MNFAQKKYSIVEWCSSIIVHTSLNCRFHIIQIIWLVNTDQQRVIPPVGKCGEVEAKAFDLLRCVFVHQLLNFDTCRLRSSINRLVTDGNTKLCCHGFVLALFQNMTANKIDSEHTWDYTKLLPVCKVEILQITVNKIEGANQKTCVYRTPAL